MLNNYDLIAISIIFFGLLLLNNLRIINTQEFIYFALKIFISILICTTIIPVNTFPDQTRYLICVNDFIQSKSCNDFGTTYNLSFFYSLSPFLIKESNLPLVVINYLITLIFYLNFKKNINLLLIILLVPSFFLYSSLNLKDSVIPLFSYMLAYAALNNKIKLLLISVFFLFFLRLHSIFLVIFSFFTYIFIFNESRLFKLLSFMILLTLFFYAADLVNMARFSSIRENPLFLENGQFYKWLYIFSGSIFLPYNFNSPLHFLASIETIIIDMVILYIILNYKKYRYFKFSIIYFVINTFFFGYTVLNVGTYTRYKVEYLIVFLMLIYTNNNNDQYNSASL